MTKRQNTALAAQKLPILAAIEAIAQEMKESYGDDSEGDLLEFYGESYLENLSEAGYTETRPNDRLSIRAFGHLVRVKTADLKTVKELLGHDASSYRDFALCDNILSALSRSAELAPALRLLAPAEGAKSTGPFYPSRYSFDVAAALKARPSYIAEVQERVGKDPALDAAAIKLAAVFKLKGISKIAGQLKKAGVLGEAAVAHAALIALANDARLTAGLRCAQPS